MRRLIGTVGGILVAVLAIGIVEAIGHALIPTPAIVPGDPDAAAQVIARMPASAKAIVVAAWFLGTLAGAYAAVRWARWRAAAWIVAGVVIASGVATLVMIPHPLPMQLAAVAAPLIAAWIARAAAPRAATPS